MPETNMLIQPIQAYHLWSATYEPNALMKTEQRILEPWIFPARQFLDAGSGTGRYLHLAHQKGIECSIGVEPVWSMLQRSRSYAVLQGRLEQLPIKSAWAELTVCSLVLGYIQNLGQAFQELARTTQTGGTLLCSDLHPDGVAKGWKRQFKHEGKVQDILFFQHSLSDWHQAIQNAGLDVIEQVEAPLAHEDAPKAGNFDPAALYEPALIAFKLRKRV